MFYLFIFIYYIVYQVYSGTLLPSGAYPIYQSVANRNEYSDFTFFFIPETNIPPQGTFEIEFPNQFSLGLGFSINFPTCSVSCQVNGLIVTFVIPIQILAGITSNLTIYQVKNPINKGGTGNFILRSKKGLNILDENLIFGVIGIADSIDSLISTSVSIDSSGSSNAGVLTKYSFSFKTNQLIQRTSYFMLTIPESGFTLSDQPSCAAYEINNFIISGTLKCFSKKNIITITGLSSDIQSASDVGISVSMGNPSISGTTGTFEIAILKQDTNIVLAWKKGIKGVTISPGVINRVVLSQIIPILIPSKSKVMDYNLKFIPKNPLPKDSYISIELPTSMPLTMFPDLFYVEYGLEDISEDSPLVAQKMSSNLIHFYNFQEISIPGEISINFRIDNPDSAGISSPIKIISYNNNLESKIIDQDLTSAVMTVQNIGSTSGTFSSVTLSGSNLADNSLTDITFSINPSITLPGLGYIVILIPIDFTIGSISPLDCTVDGVSSKSCRKTDQLITIQLPITKAFTIGTIWSFKIINVIRKPIYEGTFLFDITTYSNDAITVLDSYTQFLIIVPNTLITTAGTLIGEEDGKETILKLEFTTILDIPESRPQKKATDIKGIIELIFDFVWDGMLGLTIPNPIPCVPIYGILPLEDYSIECKLIIPNRIEITLFQSIPSGTKCLIYIPKLKNPNSASFFYLNLIRKFNRQKLILNTQTIPTLYLASAGAALFGSSQPKAYTPSSALISTLTSMRLNTNIANTINPTVPGDYLIMELPTYDIGFIPTENTVTCFFEYGGLQPQEVECITFPKIDWILFIPKMINIAPPIVIIINNLRWPRISYTPPSPVLIRLIRNVELERKQIGNLGPILGQPIPSPNEFIYARMNVPKKGKGYPDCAFFFEFKTKNLIPDYSILKLTFPIEFSLQSSFPSVTFSVPQFKPVVNQIITFSTSSNVLTISNIAEFPAESLFTIIIKGVKNPTSMTTGYKIELMYTILGNNYLINYKDNFDIFNFGDDYSSGTIIFNSIKAYPQNANSLADYKIEFTPSGRIPSLSIIRITFPVAQYPVLPTFLKCSISGGLTTFSSCTLSGGSFVILTDEVYTTDSIIVEIKNINNPEAGITDGFDISIAYDGLFLDTTDNTDLSFRTIEIVEKPNPLSVNLIEFEPKNEGEKSSYFITFIPTSQITRSMQLMIQFPDSYDNLLGTQVKCLGIAGIIAGFDIKIESKRIFMTGLNPYFPSIDNPITVEIQNIINPNRISSAGDFRIALMLTNSYIFIDYNENAGTVEILAAPGWLKLNNITSTHYYSRLPSNYTINMTISEALPPKESQGYILIQYPSQFDIQDKDLSCNCSNPNSNKLLNADDPTLNFSMKLNCFISRNRAYISGNPYEYTGPVYLQLNNIENPILEGKTDDITIITYDYFNKRILERSYKNLDPFYFSYNYLGPLITVNSGNQILVEKGTQSTDILIELDYPCALNLTFKPSITGFFLVPSEVKLAQGFISTRFRVSVPVDYPEGTYYIQWTTLNETVPPLYTPLQKTQVVITNLKNVRLELTSDIIFNIPYGGSSLPITFFTKYAANIGIELILSLDGDYPGVTLSQKNIIFRAGDNYQSFEIMCTNDTNTTGGVLPVKGSLTVMLSGVNKDTYALISYTYPFVFINSILTTPTLTELSVNSVGQINCYINIGANEPSIAYYMIALRGTDAPPLKEIIQNGPAPSSTTLSQYGNVILGGIYRVTLNIKNLNAQTPYTMFVYLVNRGGNINSVKTLDFQTLNRYYATNIELQFKQSYLNKAEKKNIIVIIAFLLSLYPIKIQEQKYFFSNRELQSSSDQSLTLLNLQISTVDNSTDYPSPYQMGLSLRTKTSKMTSMLTNFDSSYYIKVTEFKSYIPTFVETPNITLIDQYYCVIQVKLNNYGYVFAIALNASEDKSKPTSFQIFKGYNSFNIPIPQGFVEISQSFAYFTFNITNLTPNTQYNVYITSGSVHPGYPDLLDDKSIVLLGIQTKPLIIWDPLDINFSNRIYFKVFFFYLVILIINISL